MAEEHTAIEATVKKVTFEHEEGDVLYAVASEVADELERPRKDQDRLQDELDCSYEDPAAATRDFSNCWAAQEATTAASTAAAVTTSSAFREVGSLGQPVRAADKATHSLTCGVLDRESNEVKYFRESTELIEGYQMQLQSGQPMSGPPS